MSNCCTQNYNRTIVRGDSDRFKITFTKKTIVNNKEHFEPIDITGWTVRFTVREEVPATSIIDDKDAILSITADVFNPKEGMALIYVPAELTTKIEPGNYFYDVQYIRPADEYGFHQVRSIRKAKYTVVGDITRDNAFRLNGGCCADFKDTDETDYVVYYEEMIDEKTGAERLMPVSVLNPCKDYNGGSAEKEPIDRFIVGGDAKAEIPKVKFTQHKPLFTDPVEDEYDDADDGYEI